MNRGRGWLRLVRLVGAALPAIAGMGVAQAHEAGTTRVVTSFAYDDTYRIEVSADAGAVLARLEAATGRPRSTSNTVADYQRGFDLLCDEIPRHLAATFDGVRSDPQATCLVDPGDSGAPAGLSVPGVTATLRGKIPPGARTFTWQYGLTFTSYSLILKSHDPNTKQPIIEQTVWLEGDQESQPSVMARVDQPPARSRFLRSYFNLGFTHLLLGGPDYILFVLGIFLLSRRLLPVLMQVAAFTVAHSIALGLTLNGTIALPSSVVEPMIALVIVYVALENLVTSDLKPWRLALVSGFGLLHGMAPSGLLRQLALPRGEFLTGLAAFNAGVAAGQLGIILAGFLIVGSWARRHEGYRRFVVLPGSSAIAVAALFWTMQRLVLR
jgi:hypothetical protein